MAKVFCGKWKIIPVPREYYSLLVQNLLLEDVILLLGCPIQLFHEEEEELLRHLPFLFAFWGSHKNVGYLISNYFAVKWEIKSMLNIHNRSEALSGPILKRNLHESGKCKSCLLFLFFHICRHDLGKIHKLHKWNSVIRTRAYQRHNIFRKLAKMIIMEEEPHGNRSKIHFSWDRMMDQRYIGLHSNKGVMCIW